jgi:hypothetical protein
VLASLLAPCAGSTEALTSVLSCLATLAPFVTEGLQELRQAALDAVSGANAHRPVTVVASQEAWLACDTALAAQLVSPRSIRTACLMQ